MNELDLLLRHVMGPNNSEKIRLQYERYCSQHPATNLAGVDFRSALARLALQNGCVLFFADIWTRLFQPSSPLRHRLNFAVAAMELDPATLLAQAPSVFHSRLSLVGHVCCYFLGLLASGPVIAFLYLRYRLIKK